MKTIKNLLLAAAIVCSSIAFAGTEPADTEPSTSICKEIGSLLNDHTLKADHMLSANVTFIVNKNNEIVVLEVDTDQKEIEYYVKARLNYKKLTTNAKKGIHYFLPVKLEASS